MADLLQPKSALSSFTKKQIEKKRGGKQVKSSNITQSNPCKALCVGNVQPTNWTLLFFAQA